MLSKEYKLTLDKAYGALRRLAKTMYWQSLYANTKELHLNLFSNSEKYSCVQLEFLRVLGYIYDVVTDVSCSSVHEIVLSDDIYINAYQYYKNKKHLKEKEKVNKENLINSHQKKFNDKYKPKDKWVFK